MKDDKKRVILYVIYLTFINLISFINRVHKYLGRLQKSKDPVLCLPKENRSNKPFKVQIDTFTFSQESGGFTKTRVRLHRITLNTETFPTGCTMY